MLRVDRLPEVFNAILADGVEGAALMTLDGGVLSSVVSDASDIKETNLAALSSSVWNNMKQGDVALRLSCDSGAVMFL